VPPQAIARTARAPHGQIALIEDGAKGVNMIPKVNAFVSTWNGQLDKVVGHLLL